MWSAVSVKASVDCGRVYDSFLYLPINCILLHFIVCSTMLYLSISVLPAMIFGK